MQADELLAIVTQELDERKADEEINHMAKNAYIYGTIQMKKKIRQIKQN